MVIESVEPLDAILEVMPNDNSWESSKAAIIEALLVLMTRFRVGEEQMRELMVMWHSANCPGLKTMTKPILDEAIKTAKSRIPIQQIKSDIERHLQGETDTIALPWDWLEYQTHALSRGELVLFGGPIKSGKSFFLIHIALELDAQGVKWAYLPLEDAKKDFGCRLMAALENDYSMLDRTPATAHHRASCLLKREKQITKLLKNVEENPRVGHVDKNGNSYTPKFNHIKLLKWVREKAQTVEVLFIDNLAQIEFDNKNQNYQETDLVRELLSIAKDTKTIIILCAHTVKRRGKDADAPLTEGDFQGSAMLTRLAHTSLMLDKHRPKASKVLMEDGSVEYYIHNNTLYIPACRNGRGTRSSIAFSMGAKGPLFEEFGIIASTPKKEKSKNE